MSDCCVGHTQKKYIVLKLDACLCVLPPTLVVEPDPSSPAISSKALSMLCSRCCDIFRPAGPNCSRFACSASSAQSPRRSSPARSMGTCGCQQRATAAAGGGAEECAAVALMAQTAGSTLTCSTMSALAGPDAAGAVSTPNASSSMTRCRSLSTGSCSRHSSGGGGAAEAVDGSFRLAARTAATSRSARHASGMN